MPGWHGRRNVCLSACWVNAAFLKLFLALLFLAKGNAPLRMVSLLLGPNRRSSGRPVNPRGSSGERYPSERVCGCTASAAFAARCCCFRCPLLVSRSPGIRSSKVRALSWRGDDAVNGPFGEGALHAGRFEPLSVSFLRQLQHREFKREREGTAGGSVATLDEFCIHFKSTTGPPRTCFGGLFYPCAIPQVLGCMGLQLPSSGHAIITCPNLLMAAVHPASTTRPLTSIHPPHFCSLRAGKARHALQVASHDLTKICRCAVVGHVQYSPLL
ncbi:hypothetical protein B0T26DRAFT_270771 [Lasiosphaeria miniovina]|uniref:Uncharacterized protein n=1 Tax=Lasiosphaeria miniovina TaxID=1954250 RepID=A0AA40AJG2_9PEZI|nr:uncharacterized protein B0T26DRAFT_270771 [Lasiosphaeria miniovina]KAK0716939.1 hypothetical protein B0T26DRAFT_270771 [Lasiosphaeria miniovina]